MIFPREFISILNYMSVGANIGMPIGLLIYPYNCISDLACRVINDNQTYVENTANDTQSLKYVSLYCPGMVIVSSVVLGAVGGFFTRVVINLCSFYFNVAGGNVEMV